MFTKDALENIKKTGNVWGINIQDVIDRTVQLGKLKLRIRWRKKGPMGRFGGGWNYHIGIQWSRFSYIIFYCLVFCIYFEWIQNGD